MAQPSSAARACAMEAISTHQCSSLWRLWFELLNSVRNAEEMVADVDYVELQPEANLCCSYVLSSMVILPIVNCFVILMDLINFIVTDIAASPIVFRQPVIMTDSQSFMHTSAEDILSGCSAGDLASMLHCDEFRDLFPNTTEFKCLSDGGMFLDA
ncbi:hypothetical protein Patl1_14882 [Pistacia atlantica]|uniref:Uncharacterized protein n=1 Tax=Pistacia atlantica TaxID=434234 RepID=A0ACC1AV05_9ROSI|nr:hypothetical protein Patl1_14882 [Pistacia atlantica]